MVNSSGYHTVCANPYIIGNGYLFGYYFLCAAAGWLHLRNHD